MKRFVRVMICMAVMACIMGCDRFNMSGGSETEKLTLDVNKIMETTDATEETSSALKEIVMATRPLEPEEGEEPYAVKAAHAKEIRGIDGWLSEYGIIRKGANGSKKTDRLYLIPIDDDKSFLLCNVSNCPHTNAGYYVYSETRCMSALYISEKAYTYHNGNVYFIVGFLDSDVLIKMNAESGERSIMAEWPSHTFYRSIVCNGNYMYAYIQGRAEKNSSGEYITHTKIMEINLEDGSNRYVAEDAGDIFFDVAGNTIYTSREIDGITEQVAININTLEQTVIAQEDWSSYRAPYDGDSFYYYDKAAYELGIMNIDGTIEKRLLKGNPGELFGAGWDMYSHDGFIYKRDYDYEDEPKGTYFMDMKTGEVTNITDEAKIYGIYGYDGYYGMFLASKESATNEDVTYEYVYSKERILSEARNN